MCNALHDEQLCEQHAGVLQRVFLMEAQMNAMIRALSCTYQLLTSLDSMFCVT
jgi:hypothetical protein